eukprot:scaffold92426_cov17-Tisochrysis_lutea.AAC.1
MVLEARVRDLDIRALAGEQDVITLKIDLLRASSLLKVSRLELIRPEFGSCPGRVLSLHSHRS